MSIPYFPEVRPDLLKILEDAKIWIREAGQLALKDFENVSLLPAKTDDTLLTTTDLAIENFLASKIQQKYPDHNLLTEENGHKQTGSPYTWVIDPLDGTTIFTCGLPGWGISIALLQDGQPKIGLYYMPLLDDLTYVTPHITIWKNQRLHWTVQADWGIKGFLATNARAHHNFQINVERTRTLGSVATSLVYTARGSATGAFIPRAYLWDLAAGALILQQAGGELRYLQSATLVELSALLHGRHAPEPIIAGHPAVLDRLHEAIQIKPTSEKA
ncbi:MAG: inositol monophosphatase [Anaerolineae bacterium]|nr:inositol monophosphatase [Anaerolineae bacterium]